MFKLLILNDDIKSIKKISNNILSRANFIRIVGIVENLDELNDFISKNKIDIIFLSHSYYIALSKTNILQNNPLFIILSDSIIHSGYRKYSNRLYISNLISDKQISSIFETFIISKDNDYLKSTVSNILMHLKFNFTLIGTKYLSEAIVYSYINRNSYKLENLESNVYPYIAQKYKTTVNNVKWSIVRSINSMYLNHTTHTCKDLSNYFNMEYLKKPTAKVAICTIVNKLSENIKRLEKI